MAAFETKFLGCKVSFADAQAIRERLLGDGHREVGSDGEITVISTCCVTNEAVAKSRQAASRAARPRDGSSDRLCGKAEERSPALPETSSSYHGPGKRLRPSWRGTSGQSAASRPTQRLDRVRAFVKIQDGCSFSCRFCVIPLVRGGTRSREAAAVLGEIRRRAGQGHREIVLTGVNLGCFRDRAAGTRSLGSCARPGRCPGSSGCDFPRSRSTT